MERVMSSGIPGINLVVLGIMGLMFFMCRKGAGKDSRNFPELKTVEKVELSRYLGKWYEIATIPASFQKKCAGGTSATYSLREDGAISVLNQCYLKDGKVSQAKGRAWVADKNTNAELKVSFIPFLRLNFLAGDYWIIDLGENYEYAVVGHPSREYGWILSRTPELPDQVLKGIISRLEGQGYDFSRFKMTNQKDYQE